MITAYVPCYNNEATIAHTVASLLRQTVPPGEVVVVDDGSSDRSPAVAASAGARVVRLVRNFGRGTANARGIREAAGDLVVCCGATNVLEPDFVERAIPWFDDRTVAAVYARVFDPTPKGAVGRWRARHLFRTGTAVGVARRASLITTGCILRRAAVLSAGGFNEALRHTEDAELGQRLLAHGFDVVFDPRLHVISASTNTVAQVLERYWRWGAGVDEPVSAAWYLKQVAYSVKVMARQDLAAGDVSAVAISLVSPHYQFWKSVARRLRSTARPR